MQSFASDVITQRQTQRDVKRALREQKEAAHEEKRGKQGEEKHGKHAADMPDTTIISAGEDEDGEQSAFQLHDEEKSDDVIAQLSVTTPTAAETTSTSTPIIPIAAPVIDDMKQARDRVKRRLQQNDGSAHTFVHSYNTELLSSCVVDAYIDALQQMRTLIAASKQLLSLIHI